MKLYSSPASPFVRKVRVVLHETGMHDKVEQIAATGTAVDPAQMPLALNPLGKIPALERADGPALYDSRVICRYLDEMAGTGLYPDGPALWDALILEATGDGIMDAAVLMVYEGRIRPAELQYAPWVEGQWAKVTRALDALESRWMGHLSGRFGIGHVAIGCALGYLDFRHGGRDWRTERPALASWYAKTAQRNSFSTTVPVA
jgi:glutathione S-transferase